MTGCQHGNDFETCTVCAEQSAEDAQTAAYNEIMADVHVPEAIDPGMSVKDIYATLKLGRRVALTFETHSETANMAAKLHHHLSVIRSADKKLTQAFHDFVDFTIAFKITTVGDSPALRRVIFSREIPTETKRFISFEILD